jgi:hypothetical protein
MDPSEGRSDGGGLAAWPPFYCLLDGTNVRRPSWTSRAKYRCSCSEQKSSPNLYCSVKGPRKKQRQHRCGFDEGHFFCEPAVMGGSGGGGGPEPMEVRSERKKQSGVSEWNTPKRYLN